MKRRDNYRSDQSLAKSVYILDRIAQGATINQIAIELNVTEGSIRARLREEYQAFLEDMTNIVAGIKIDHTQRLEYIYRQAVQSWQISADVNKTTGEPQADGDIQYLNMAMKAMSEIRKIWNADRELEVTEAGALLPVGKEKKELGASPNPVKDVLTILQSLEAIPSNIDYDKIIDDMAPIEGNYEELDDTE